ncbi:uncharacterized protein LOC106165741 [Lingula anatina]|uniref:Uncharacterized protein LOC106165741 n=1 Tax=Lingula anatina TaxID=7574 RepID=A0A1S3IPQ5_LINAN|nr:uncharacterized protein LOC106165741 [Lingula anatina]|eukprot:XP_013399524.1 uncharacterized protein LOC106165741 [Lingula anatina]
MDPRLLFIWTVAVLAGSLCGQEVFKNNGIESDNFANNWRCRQCVLEQSPIKHTGKFSGKVTKRRHDYSGPTQSISLTKGAFYEITSFVKLLNDKPGEVHTRISATLHVRYSDGTQEWKKVAVGSYMRSTDDWKEVGGSFRAPEKDFKLAEITFSDPDPSVSFLLDSASLQRIPELTGNWKINALQRIEQIRKADLSIDLSVGDEYGLNDIEVEVTQIRSEFAMGGTVRADAIVAASERKFHKFVEETFEWTTIANALKWRMMQRNQYPINSERPKLAIEELLSLGKKIRGHNVVWGVEQFIPTWVKTLSKEEIKGALDTRIKGVINTFKGNLSHWDVNNEIIAGHGDWFEQKTGDRYITEKMFQQIHALDPNVKLFHNEYRVINDGSITNAYVDMIKEYQAKGLPLSGIGVQGHLKVGPPDILKIQQNLDKLALTGLPIWITELDIEASDVAKRADYYEDVMTYLFSYPGVEGIILWSWHDNGNRNAKAGANLADGLGDKFKLNAAGERVKQLMTKTWKTNQVLQPISRSSTLRLRGFKGDYTITVKYNGSSVAQKKITLGQSGATVNLQIGTKTTASAVLTCVTRWSKYSEIGDDKRVTASCKDGEIMTGCSSKSVNDQETKDGEKFSWDTGIKQRVCQAINGFGSTAPVQAIAQCCKGPSDLQCTYSSSRVSKNGDGEQTAAVCPTGYLPTGCLSRSAFSSSAGVLSKMESRSCVAENDDLKNPKYGVYSHAACCKASGLHCVSKSSVRSDSFVGNKTAVACDNGYTATGCNAYNEFGGIAGAYISNPYCIAVNGRERDAPNQGVIAVITCCRL